MVIIFKLLGANALKHKKNKYLNKFHIKIQGF